MVLMLKILQSHTDLSHLGCQGITGFSLILQRHHQVVFLFPQSMNNCLVDAAGGFVSERFTALGDQNWCTFLASRDWSGLSSIVRPRSRFTFASGRSLSGFMQKASAHISRWSDGTLMVREEASVRVLSWLSRIYLFRSVYTCDFRDTLWFLVDLADFNLFKLGSLHIFKFIHITAATVFPDALLERHLRLAEVGFVKVAEVWMQIYFRSWLPSRWFSSPSRVWSGTSCFSALCCWNVGGICWYNSCVLKCELVILFLSESETKRNRKLMSECDWRHSFAIKWINPLWRSSLLIITLPKLSVVIVAPRIQSPTSSEDEGNSTFWDLEVKDVKWINTLDPMWSIEFTENAFSPNKKLLVSWQGSGETSGSDLNHPGKRQLFKQDRNGRTFRWWASAKLALSVGTHDVHFSFESQYYRMCDSTGYWVHFVWKFANVHRSLLIPKWTQSKLSILTPTTGEKSTDIVNKSWMLRATINLLNIWFVIVFKVDKAWTKYNSHPSWASVASTTLTVIVVSPTVDLSIPAEH